MRLGKRSLLHRALPEGSRRAAARVVSRQRRGLRPRVVVITVARDEGSMLDRWVTHYGDQVGRENLIVFDDNSADGSTDRLDCTVHRLPGFAEGKFESQRLKLVNGVSAGLLATYDVVVFVDVDEFLVADPDRHEDFRSFLRSRREQPILGPVALNVVHHVGIEGPLDQSRPVLEQRHFAKFAPIMCSPAVKRVPAAWVRNVHSIRAPFVVDPELFMVHLKFYDRDALRSSADRRQALASVTHGSGNKTAWARTGDEMVSLLESFVGHDDPDTVPEFDPSVIDLAGLVMQEGDIHRTPRQGQVQAMMQQPLVRMPKRLHGIV